MFETFRLHEETCAKVRAYAKQRGLKHSEAVDHAISHAEMFEELYDLKTVYVPKEQS